MPDESAAHNTENEIADASRVLQKLQPGFLPRPIFEEIARLVVLSIIDVVPVRKSKNGSTEVLLTQRESRDHFWPDMWHNPGTVIRPTDDDSGYADALNRVFADELGVMPAPEAHFVTGFLHKTRRGSESTLVYWAELLDTPRNGTFFEVKSLPPATIQSHIDIIQTAAKAYEEATRVI